MSEFVGDARDWDWSWLTPATHPNGFASLFQDCVKFNQDLDGWNTSGVANLAGTFWGARAFNGSIGGWNTSQEAFLRAGERSASPSERRYDPGGGRPVAPGLGRLALAQALPPPGSQGPGPNQTWGELRFHATSGYHLYAAPGLAYVPPLNSLSDTGLVRVWDYSFAGVTSDLGCDTSYGLNVSGAESAVGVFEGSTGVARPHGASRWDTRRLRNASRAFAGLPALATLDLSRWNTALLEDVTEMFAGGSALTRTGVGGWTSLPSLSRFSELFRGVSPDFREALTAWTTPALAPGSVDCTQLAPYTVLDPTRWPAACSRSLFSALVRTTYPSATTALALAPTAGPGANFTVDWGDGSAPGSCAHAAGRLHARVRQRRRLLAAAQRPR
eukprot:g53183.t1